MKQTPYSPDLAMSDDYLFPILKKHLRRRRFSGDKHLRDAVQEFFEDISKELFGRHSFIGISNKCVSFNGSYVEK